MGLDISVTNKRTEQSLDMNWLRNPYGLCDWSEHNYSYAMERELPGDRSLWHVINTWNYSKSSEVDKPLFLEVVMKHAKVIMQLEQGYFWFDASGFRQFIAPNMEVLPHSEESDFRQYAFEGTVRYHFHNHGYIGIPMQHFGRPRFGLSDRYRPNAHTLVHYQEWYRELIELAEMLQDPDAEFYCSN